MLDEIKHATGPLVREGAIVVTGFLVVIVLMVPAMALIWYGQPVLGILWVLWLLIWLPLKYG